MKFEFCWEHRDCDRLCPVKESQSIFCWRIARTEKLCHPDTCADVYLVKPFQSSELEGHIKTLI